MNKKEQIKKETIKPITKTKVDYKKQIKKEIKKPITKVDYKKQIQELKEYAKNLEKKNIILKWENQKNIYDFQEKAKLFSSKAQSEVNKLKKELNKKAYKDKKEIQMYGAQKLLESILDPINRIKIAIDSGKKNGNSLVHVYVQGFEMLINQLFDELSSHGLKTIIPQIGDDFNPQKHEAIETIEGKPTNKIIEIKKIGFKLHNRVIKPAMVIIGK